MYQSQKDIKCFLFLCKVLYNDDFKIEFIEIYIVELLSTVKY